MRAASALFLMGVGIVLSARAFVLDVDTNGNRRRWDLGNTNNIHTNVVNAATRSVRFYIAADGYSTTNTEAEINAVRASFAQWQSVPGATIKFEEAGLIASGAHVDPADHTNMVFWARTNTTDYADIQGILALTYWSVFSDQTMGGADIILNGVDFNWFTDFNDKRNSGFYIEGVLMHEVGHFIGLQHSPVGGATMMFAGSTGVSTQSGLSADEMAAARTLYPDASALANYSTASGRVTRNGAGILGAAVFLEDSGGNAIAGTMTLSDGSYQVSGVPPGNYTLRAAPLDPNSGSLFLISGPAISSGFNAAVTDFLPGAPASTTLQANATNTVDLAVTNATPLFRIARVGDPVSGLAGAYPVQLQLGDTGVAIVVYGSGLPTNNATFGITGTGVTNGIPTFQNVNLGGFGTIQSISTTVSIATNAPPGIRNLYVQQGTNTAWANGFVEILPAIPDYNFDGLDDRFQRQYFKPFTATNAAPGADPDGDAFPNASEYVAGTSPTNSASVLVIDSVTQNGSGTTITWRSINNRKYQVYSRPQFGSGSFQPLGAPVTATGSTCQYLDASATGSIRFYRVQVLP
jgi:hypothetical protein